MSFWWVPRTSTVVDIGTGWRASIKTEGPVTILALKQSVEFETGIPVERLTLIEGAEPLDDDLVLSGGVRAFHVTVQPLPPDTKLNIRVTCVYPEDIEYEQVFEVKETDTVKELKEKIFDSNEFQTKVVEKAHERPTQARVEDVKLWRIYYVQMKEDDTPLSKYLIHDGCDLQLVFYAIYREVCNAE